MTTKPKCQAHLVTQGHCRRVATETRQTVAGVLVRLCRQCGNSYGDIVGKKVENA